MAAFASSYIKTEASQVTRSADAASMTGANFSSWYRQDEGTLFSEFSINGYNPSSAFPTVAVISDGTYNNQIVSGNTNAGANLYTYGQISVNNVNQAGFFVVSPSFGANSTQRTALAYKFNDFAMSKMAATVQTDNSGNVPVVNRLSIGANAITASFLQGHIRKLSFYPQRLQNAQLQALTS